MSSEFVSRASSPSSKKEQERISVNFLAEYHITWNFAGLSISLILIHSHQESGANSVLWAGS